MSGTTYNIHQQAWVLCVGSSINLGVTGTQASVQKTMSAQLQPILDSMSIGNWKVVWGPNTWKANPDDTKGPADNTWYIAHNPSAVFEDGKPYDTYFVSIAATASSDVDREEDYDVFRVVDFEKWAELGFDTVPSFTERDHIDETKPYLAFGTAKGVHRILTIPGNKEGTTILQFLGTIPPTSRIVFTGISLGGVLSPTLALAVAKAGLVKNPVSNILTYPIAGPSPGNGPFADLYAKTFPRIQCGNFGYQVWNTNLWNTYDMIPHAWNSRTVKGQCLDEIPVLFGKLPCGLDFFVRAKIIATQVLLRGVPVYMPLQGTKIVSKTVMYQHVFAYYGVFGTPIVPTLSGQAPEYKHIPVLNLLGKVKEGTDGENLPVV
ncbi:hypothetical protein ONZ45_g6460 [Pleurotus djamor]|nr:hypothetical protein ONZ45_g6460 [Pleurotus djamor]